MNFIIILQIIFFVYREKHLLHKFLFLKVFRNQKTKIFVTSHFAQRGYLLFLLRTRDHKAGSLSLRKYSDFNAKSSSHTGSPNTSQTIALKKHATFYRSCAAGAGQLCGLCSIPLHLHSRSISVQHPHKCTQLRGRVVVGQGASKRGQLEVADSRGRERAPLFQPWAQVRRMRGLN
jgi:hypothetical protein